MDTDKPFHRNRTSPAAWASGRCSQRSRLMRGPASQKKRVATSQEQKGLPESQDSVHYFHDGHCRHHPTGQKHPAQPGSTMETLVSWADIQPPSGKLWVFILMGFHSVVSRLELGPGVEGGWVDGYQPGFRCGEVTWGGDRWTAIPARGISAAETPFPRHEHPSFNLCPPPLAFS